MIVPEFQATALNNRQHHYAIQKAPDGSFYVWKHNYPSANTRGPVPEKLILTVDELREKFALGEWNLLEGSIP
jgi:hypothetical protein